ncbi:Ger(x)C family spore germination protein [Neobacillus drentensis]|jgi:spore germination protein KC|uniref:Ger(x)C family spore germination protein n=1 Tax=Neobacillus drentensis TaxID=220684 RepID=UPI002FFFC910
MNLKKIMLNMTVNICMILLLCGCWDKKELEERAYVIGLGMAKNHESNKIDITFLIANPEVGSQQSGSGSKEPAREIITITANDFITARNTANAIVARELTYDLLRVFVVSEQLAGDKDFIRYIYDATKDREIKRDAYLIVSKEDPRVFFTNNKPKLETRPHKYFQFMITRGIETGLIPDSDLHRFFRVTENDDDLFLAMYATTKLQKGGKRGNEDEYLAGQIDTEGTSNQTQFIGAAVFKEGKMIGKITGQETRISVLLDDTAELNDVLTTYPDPFNKKLRVAARVIKKQNNDINIEIKQGPPKIKVTLPLTIEILSDPSMVNYGAHEDKKKILKKHLENVISKKIEAFVNKTQTEFKGEPFTWSAEVRKQFKTISEYKKYNWMKVYPDAQVEIKAAITLGEFGKQEKVPNLEKLRD